LEDGRAEFIAEVLVETCTVCHRVNR